MNRFLQPGNLQEISEAFHFPGLIEKTAAIKKKINELQNHKEIKS
jgi:hypothetical protein